MRAKTKLKIDKLHSDIAKLIAAEKAHSDKQNKSQTKLQRHIRHAAIDMMEHSPRHKALFVEASARL